MNNQTENNDDILEEYPEMKLLINELVSPSAEVRENADFQLSHWIFHQGDSHEATEAVARRLIAHLQKDDVPGKATLISILTAMMDHFEGREETRWDYEYALAGATVAAQGLPLYLKFLHDADAGVRSASADALNYYDLFRDHADEIVTALYERILIETDPYAKATAISTWSNFIRARHDIPASYRALWEDLQLRGEDRLIRTLGAYTELKVLGEEVSPTALGILIESIVKPIDQLEGTYLLLGVTGALLSLPAEKAFTITQEIFPQLNNDAKARSIAIDLLNNVFNKHWSDVVGYRGETHRDTYVLKNFEARSPETITPMQYRALQLVLKADIVWAMDNNLLEIYGLPASREETRQILSELSAKF
jgi:hypothetical protein